MYSDPDSKGAISQVSESTSNRQDTSASSVPETRLFLKRKVVETTNSSVDEFEYLHTSPKSQGNKGGKIGALQARRRNEEVEITPEIAARAVREYLLPMFEAEGRVQTSKARNAVFHRKGLDQLPHLEAVSGTVYGELKLSDELSGQLTELRVVLRDKEQQLRDALQERESTKSEYFTLQKSLNKALSDLQLVNYQYSVAEKHQQQAELRFSNVNAQLSEFKHLYTQCEIDKKQLTSLIHEEKAINDKLKNRATELEHGNSLLKMENDIIGERLKGLYEAINHISDKKMLEEKLSGEVETLARGCFVLTEFDTEVTMRTANALAERDHLREDYAEMSKMRLEAKEAREVLAIQSKEKITSLQESLAKSLEEIEFLKVELDKTEKLCKGMEDEMGKMRTKMKQNRLKRRQYGEAEEKICKKCQKVFTDVDNFNWSCRTHKGEYSDEMWWCCGKTAKDAPGCLVSPHESKDDDEEEGSKAKEETERQKIANMRCSVTPYTELQRNRPPSQRMPERPKHPFPKRHRGGAEAHPSNERQEEAGVFQRDGVAAEHDHDHERAQPRGRVRNGSGDVFRVQQREFQVFQVAVGRRQRRELFRRRDED